MTGTRIPATIELPPDVLAVLAEQVAALLGPIQVDTSPWMTIDQTSTYLSWSRDRLYKLTSGGGIPHRKVGNRVLFHRDELDAWLEGYREGPRTSWKSPARVSRDFQCPMDTGIAS
jgi:excisionase family DNA binding protein